MYSLNTNLWPFTTPNVRTTCRIWKIITFLEFLSQGRRSDILLNKFQALLIFDPLITLWGHFEAPYFKMLNDARVASACLHVRTCQRVRNSKNIATIRDFHLPSSFFCLSTRLDRACHCIHLAHLHEWDFSVPPLPKLYWPRYFVIVWSVYSLNVIVVVVS